MTGRGPQKPKRPHYSNQASPSQRGGAPVGLLSELPPVEMAAIQYLRLWFSGQQAQVWHDFSRAFGREDARSAMETFERLMTIVQQKARRPLLRHTPACACFGGDECAFAHFIAAATIGDEHDAMTFGLHLFDSIQAKSALGAAAMCGHAFYSMAGGPMPACSPTHAPPRQHQ